MNIVLKQKDADWIANVIREQIKDLQEAYEEALEEGRARSKLCNSLVDQLSGFTTDGKDIVEARKELEDVKIESESRLNQKYNEKFSTYCRILELVMCGSESLEA